MGQILHLMNNAGINGRLASKSGIISRLIVSRLAMWDKVRDIYLTAFSRLPTPDEERRAVDNLDSLRSSTDAGLQLLGGKSWIPASEVFTAARKRRERAEDLRGAFMNTKEFVFNH